MLTRMNGTFWAVEEHVIVSWQGVRTSVPNDWEYQP